MWYIYTMKLLKIHNIVLSLIPNSIFKPLFYNVMKYRARSFKKSGFDVVFGKNVIELIKNNKKIIIGNKHLVYLTDIKNMFDYYFNSLASDKINNFSVLDFSKPKKHTFKNTGLSFYFTSIPEDDWEIKEYLSRYSIKRGDIVFDVGSYCGYSVYNFSKKNGKNGKVYCFEPDEDNYKMLIKNIKAHDLKNVIPIKKGLWSEATILEFFKEGALGSSIKSMGYRPTHSVKFRIKVLKLEDAYKEFKLKKINFVKMDIEGAEVEVIESSLEFIKNKNIHFAISCHPRNINGRSINTSEILAKLFKKIGYKTNIKVFTYRTYEAYMIYAEKAVKS